MIIARHSEDAMKNVKIALSIILPLACIIWMMIGGKLNCGDSDYPPPENPSTRSFSGKALPKDARIPIVDSGHHPSPPPTPPPEPTQVPGRCEDQRLLNVIKEIVSDHCHKGICRRPPNPLISFSQHGFETLFGRNEDDAGFASHFALFGCNIYGPSDCYGYDAHFADNEDCPINPEEYDWIQRHPDHPYAGVVNNCIAYSKAIKTLFRKFVEDHKNAKYFIFIGTASRTGNKNRVMHENNVKLAHQRALSVRKLFAMWRASEEPNVRIEGITAGTYVVVLNNEEHRFDTPEFGGIVRKQLAKEGMTTNLNRGFVPTTANAINRSVLVLAVSCNLD